MPNSAPVGIFDSGVGGLSVLRDIRALLPHEDLLYVADSGHVPYGSKTPQYIQARSLALASFLTRDHPEQHVKAIVIACNTATAAAAGLLRSRFEVPIVAMEPAVKPAVAATRRGVVGVLATVGMLRSAQFAALLDRFGRGVEVVTQPCPGLVELVEAGELNGRATRKLVEQYTTPLLEHGVDTIVLGCTHYPLLRPLIEDVVGPDIALIDTGRAVAQQLRRVLEGRDLRSERLAPGKEDFWTSADVGSAQRVIRTLWGGEPTVRRLPEEFS